jgi:hypothetical protein
MKPSISKCSLFKSKIVFASLAATLCAALMRFGCDKLVDKRSSFWLAPLDVSSSESQSALNMAMFKTDAKLALFESVFISREKEHFVYARAVTSNENFHSLQNALSKRARQMEAADMAQIASQFDPIFNIPKETISAVWKSTDSCFEMVVSKSLQESFDLHIRLEKFSDPCGKDFKRMVRRKIN